MSGNKAPRWKPRVKIVRLMEIEYLAGVGTEDDPARVAWVYYDLDGTYIATRDSNEEAP